MICILATVSVRHLATESKNVQHVFEAKTEVLGHENKSLQISA